MLKLACEILYKVSTEQSRWSCCCDLEQSSGAVEQWSSGAVEQWSSGAVERRGGKWSRVGAIVCAYSCLVVDVWSARDIKRVVRDAGLEPATPRFEV